MLSSEDLVSAGVRVGGVAPTLDNVAALAGVSRATASRAINGGRRVSPSAMAAVQAAVGQLGYAPNRAARSLVTRRSDSVALLVPEPDERVFSDPFFAATLRAVSQTLAPTELQLVLLLAGPGDGGSRTARYLRHRHVDGTFVVSHHRNDGLADEIADMGIPCVFGGRPWSGGDRVSYVDADNVTGGRTAAERLIARGCRRIATIAGPEDMTASVDRLEGWRTALRAAALSTDMVVHGDFTEDGGRLAALELLHRHPDLDGLFAASDLMATGAVSVLTAQGRRVPDDVSIVGYDDLGVAERCTPPLTTVCNPVAEMAQRGVELLLEQLASGADWQARHVLLSTDLVVRDSA